ncbi:LA_3751/LA_3752 family putative glycosyltransferase [Leptospira perdikensis]|nr:hypothetical protein [Leptospira perdikensis]
MKTGILWIFFILVVFYSIEYTQPRYSLFQDSHDKAVQTYSIWQNHFLSDNLYYPAKAFDPNLEFFHLAKNLYIKTNEKLVSAFPIQFAYLLAPFLFVLPISFLPYTSLLFLLLTFFFLKRYYHFSLLLITISFFGTFLWPLSWEYSELPAIFAFSTIALYPFLKKGSSVSFQLISGVFLAWIIIVRLDTLPFFGIFFLSHLYFYLKRNGFQQLQSYLKSYSAFLLSTIVFLILYLSINQSLYGHFLGTRFLANSSGFSAGFSKRLQWFLSLLFYSNRKIGFFGYLPFAFILFTVYWYKYKTISDSKKILLIATSLTLLIIPFIAPNDGFNNWGPRFYTILIFPYLYLLKPFFGYYYQKRKKLFFSFLLTFGLFTFSLGILGAKLQKSKTNLEKKFAPILTEVKPDILVLQDYLNFYTCGSYYFDHIVIVSYTTDLNSKLLNRILTTNPNSKIAFITWNPVLFSKEMKEAINEDKRKSGYPISEWEEGKLETQMRLITSDFQILDRQTYRIWTGTVKSK